MFIILGYIFGVIFVTIELFVFISSKRDRILLTKTLSCVCATLNQFFFGAITGALLNFIGIARSVIFYFRGKKKWADSILWAVLFIAVTLVSPILSWQGYISLLPAFGSAFMVISFYSKKVGLIWTFGFIANVPWVIYNIFMLNFLGLAGSVLSLLSVIIGVINYFVKKKTTPQIENENI